MTAELCFNYGIVRRRITCLYNHDDMSICAQKSAQYCGKGSVDFCMDLHLTQTFLGNFYRVFDRPYLAVARVDVTEQGVQSRCLARPGRAADKQEAMRLVGERLEFFQHRGCQAYCI